MYVASGRSELRESLSDPTVRTGGWRGFGPNVWFLGLTSLVTDISSEMVTSVFPIYLVLHLQFSPLAFGAVDGLHQGGAALARLASGVLSDRWVRYRELAAVGYFTSAVSRLGLLLVGRSAPGILAVTALDRLGKGIRTSPRDALISLSARHQALASAFGVHRALDTAGALLGPLVAFALLRAMPGAYDVVFVVSFALGLIGLAVLLTFVRNPDVAPAPAPRARVSWRDALELLREPRFQVLTSSSAALGLLTISDAFLYLVLQRRLQFTEAYLPLLFVATPAVYLLLAVPMGRLADRVGRARVIVGGYAVLLAVYGLLLSALTGAPAVVLCVALLGVYYAATDGVMMALASALLPPTLRGTGLSLVTTVNNVGRVVASLGFGWLWSRYAAATAVAVFAVGLAVTLVLVWAVLIGVRREGTRA
ncbi:MAG: MFS transporter [Vicinamibacterales bacterium]|jgi:MFS family permease|nr:MFS transporter [Vicinamibacterales bacterium]